MESVTTPQLRFGNTGDGVTVDLDRLYETRLLVQGVSGAGKSTLIRSLLEQTHGHVPQFVVDSEGDFVTLREKYDYVLVGRGGDVPASAKTAKVMVRRLAELSVSAIFDLSELRFPERREWVRIACEELIHLPRTLWHTRLFVLDEAHIFCPERSSGEAESTSAVIDLVSLGRKRGLVPVCATQRLSKFHKDAAGELLNKLIGYTDDIDLQRAGDQLGMTKEQRVELKRLETHTFYAYGPAISRERVLVRTVMPATKPPPRGEARPAAPPARAAVQKVLAQLADLPKEAEEEARTLDDLRRRVAERDREIRQLKVAKPAERTVEKPVVDQGAIDRAVRAALANVYQRMRTEATHVRRALAKVNASAHEIVDLMDPAIARLDTSFIEAQGLNGSAPQPAGRREIEIRSKPIGQNRDAAAAVRRLAPQPRLAAGSPGDLSPSKLRVLNALAAFEELGIESVRKVNCAFFAGYTENGHFNNMLGELRTAGLLDYPTGGMVALTGEGRAIASAGEHPISSLSDLHGAWLNKLSPSEAKLLRELLTEYPQSVEKSELAARCGYTINGHFNNMLGHLRTMGAIDYPTPGFAAVTDVLFPQGLN